MYIWTLNGYIIIYILIHIMIINIEGEVIKLRRSWRQEEL